MRVGSILENQNLEKRIAITPEIIKKYTSLGFEIFLSKGYGTHLGINDNEYLDLGAKISNDENEILTGSDIILQLGILSDEKNSLIKEDQNLIGVFNPYENKNKIDDLVKKKANVFSLELLPRITRAQSMDILSSQANLAGYKAVIDSTAEYKKAIPMMMTAAGTIAPAKIFIMGVGVAGLQAIATARRLGGIVTATDVRPATKEQVESLGAKFIAVEDEEFKAAETAAGYAKEMSKEYQEKQSQLVSEHIKNQDIVITTALIPGRKAPLIMCLFFIKP